MNILPVRALAFAVLLLTFLSVSGANFAAAAFNHPDSTETCCRPSPGPGEDSPAAPCAAPDCPCLFCLQLPPARLADLSSPQPYSAFLFSPLLPPALADFARPIEYPPEPA